MNNKAYPAEDIAPPGAASSAVYQTVFDELNDRIRNGEWPPGERLPSIARLAKQLDVSTGSVREALRALQSIGWVTIQHGRGVFVANAESLATVTDGVMKLARDGVKAPISLLVALAETRGFLEPEATVLAATRGTEAELIRIDRLAKRMEHEAASGCDFVAPDIEFHRLIAQAARNPVLYSMLQSVNDLLLESRTLTAKEPGMTARAVHYHLLIGEALRDRNAAQARLLMLAHMNDSLSSLLAVQARLAAAKR